VTLLINRGMQEGQDTFFVFTNPQSVPSFEALNFRLLVAHGTAALLEHGPGIQEYFSAHRTKVLHGENAAVVINGNPFSLGHLHLVQEASKRVEHLYLFVVREDRSVFPFAVRYRLAAEATVDLPNVTLLDTSRYAVSAGTFPSYFLKRLDDVAVAQMQLDLRIFAEHIAPYFGIRTRYVGQEPMCQTTAAYNGMMREVLGEHGIGVVEVPRVEESGKPISATAVRAAFAQRDFKTLRSLVPESTLAFLQSPSAYGIAERLQRETKG
jgi:[citrate (pro-3S)-lyase] ligase